MQVKDFGMRKTTSGNGVKPYCPPPAFGGVDVKYRRKHKISVKGTRYQNSFREVFCCQ